MALHFNAKSLLSYNFGQQDSACNRSIKTNLTMFEYTPLPEPNHIRLLRLDNGHEKDDITGSLGAYHLDEGLP
jgi:hypothetical protein